MFLQETLVPLLTQENEWLASDVETFFRVMDGLESLVLSDEMLHYWTCILSALEGDASERHCGVGAFASLMPDCLKRVLFFIL